MQFQPFQSFLNPFTFDFSSPAVVPSIYAFLLCGDSLLTSAMLAASSKQIATFRKVLDLLNEFVGFVVEISQVSTLLQNHSTARHDEGRQAAARRRYRYKHVALRRYLAARQITTINMDSAKYFFPPAYFEQVHGKHPNLQQVPVAIPELVPKFGNEAHRIYHDAPYVKKGEQAFMTHPYQNNGIMPRAQRGPQDRNRQYQNPPDGYRREDIFRNQQAGQIEVNETKPYPVDETLTSVPRFIPPNQKQANMHVQRDQKPRYVPRQQARGNG